MWQAPVASQQITGLMIDAMRSGLTWAGEPPPTPAVAGPDGVYQRAPTPKKTLPFMMYMMKHCEQTLPRFLVARLADTKHSVDVRPGQYEQLLEKAAVRRSGPRRHDDQSLRL